MNFPNLEHLGSAYFHEDYTVVSGSAEGAMTEFIRDLVSSVDLDSFIAELKKVLKSARTEAELEHLWLDDLRAYFIPDEPEDRPYRAWFEEMLQLAITAAAQRSGDKITNP